MAALGTKGKTRFLLALLIAVILIPIAWPRFEGDGAYTTGGIFPFKGYELKLPRVSLDSPSQNVFHFRNFNSWNRSITLRLIVESDAKAPFWELSPLLHTKITDDAGNIVLIKQTRLNAHYERMKAEKRTSWPTSNEWLGHYAYRRPDISNRAVPFDMSELPMNQSRGDYWALGNLDIDPWGEYTVAFNVAEPDANFHGVTAQLIITSGPK